MEYEKSFLRLSRDGTMALASVQKAMDLAAASGVKDMAPATDVNVLVERLSDAGWRKAERMRVATAPASESAGGADVAPTARATSAPA